MVPPLTAMPHDDTEFDLDVRLQAVARHGSAEPANEKPEPPGTVTPMSCENTACRC
jgi:hypothetical protein